MGKCLTIVAMLFSCNALMLAQTEAEIRIGSWGPGSWFRRSKR